MARLDRPRSPDQCEDDYQERSGFGFFHQCPNRARCKVTQLRADGSGQVVKTMRVCGRHKQSRLREWGRYGSSESLPVEKVAVRGD